MPLTEDTRKEQLADEFSDLASALTDVIVKGTDIATKRAKDAVSQSMARPRSKKLITLITVAAVCGFYVALAVYFLLSKAIGSFFERVGWSNEAPMLSHLAMLIMSSLILVLCRVSLSRRQVVSE